MQFTQEGPLVMELRVQTLAIRQSLTQPMRDRSPCSPLGGPLQLRAREPNEAFRVQGSVFPFFFDFLILEDFLIVFLFFAFFHFPLFRNLRFFTFFLVFFCFSFSFFFFSKNIFTFGQVKSDARHGRPRHQSFRVCEVNLATRKVATTVGFHSTILVLLKRSPKEANGHCSS